MHHNIALEVDFFFLQKIMICCGDEDAAGYKNQSGIVMQFNFGLNAFFTPYVSKSCDFGPFLKKWIF